MSDDQYQEELQQAYNEFIMKVESAKKTYQQQIDEILKEIDEIKIKKIKDNLNI